MLIISVLSKKGNGILCIICISCWHIHVINEVDELVLANWCESLTSFLLKLLLHDHLEEVGISIEIEVDNLLDVVLCLGHKLVEKTLNDLSLSTSGKTDQNWAVVCLDEVSHQIRGRNSIDSRDCVGGNSFGGVNGADDIIGSHLVPVVKLGVLGIDEVVKDRAFALELDDLPFIFPPVGELLLVVLSFLPGVTSTNAPNACKDEDVLKALDLLMVEDVLEELAHAHDHRNLDLRDDMLEALGAVEQCVWDVLIKQLLQISLLLVIVFHSSNP